MNLSSILSFIFLKESILNAIGPNDDIIIYYRNKDFLF